MKKWLNQLYFLIFICFFSCNNSIEKKTTHSSQAKPLSELEKSVIISPDTIKLGKLPKLLGDTTIVQKFFIQNISKDTFAWQYGSSNAYVKYKNDTIFPNQKMENELVIGIGRATKGKQQSTVSLVFGNRKTGFRKFLYYTFEI